MTIPKHNNELVKKIKFRNTENEKRTSYHKVTENRVNLYIPKCTELHLNIFCFIQDNLIKVIRGENYHTR